LVKSLIDSSEHYLIASDKQYSIVAFPDNKTGTGRLNATESDRKDSTGTFKIPAASHKEAEPQSETRGALANMLRAIFKVNKRKRRIIKHKGREWLENLAATNAQQPQVKATLIVTIDIDY
jgi:hypothetical protein